MATDRLTAQMRFLLEADKLKSVDRANVLMDLSRAENSAEHSWHLALYAMVMAPYAASDVRLDRVMLMLLIHDLVEIDAGDMPIDQPHDVAAHRAAEEAAGKRLFGLLPDNQATALSDLWHEFEFAQTQDAIFAKRIDHLQPILQVLFARDPLPDHMQVVYDNLTTGRAARFRDEWPDMHAWALSHFDGPKAALDPTLSARLRFLAEADRLKSVTRATLLADASRRENSAEHSWHIALFARVLAEHAPQPVDANRVAQMLVLHDLVEIDAGDTPVFGQVDAAAQAAEEDAAAQRLFALLPADQCDAFLTLWREFEANETADATFGKSLDRFCPPNQNLAAGGGSWVEYNVSYATFRDRVGRKIEHGAPALWQWLEPRVTVFFQQKLGRSTD